MIFNAGTAPTYATTDIGGIPIPDALGFYPIGCHVAVADVDVVADFSATPRFGNPPILVTFSDLSSGASSWDWAFGDGGTSTLQNPSHLYTSSGVYTVTLSINSGADVKVRTAYIFICSGSPGALTDRYWISTVPGVWDSTNNWSYTCCGPSGAPIPDSTDSAYFMLPGSGSCSISSATGVETLRFGPAFDGVFNQNGQTFMVGSGGLILNGGTFEGSGLLSVDGTFWVQQNSTFLNSDTTLTLAGPSWIGGSNFIDDGSNSVVIANSCDMSCSDATIRHLLIEGGVVSLDGTAWVNTLTLSSGDFHKDASGSIHVSGDVYAGPGFGSFITLNNMPLIIDGTDTQTIHIFENAVLPGLILVNDTSAIQCRGQEPLQIQGDLYVNPGVTFDLNGSDLIVGGAE